MLSHGSITSSGLGGTKSGPELNNLSGLGGTKSSPEPKEMAMGECYILIPEEYDSVGLKPDPELIEMALGECPVPRPEEHDSVGLKPDPELCDPVASGNVIQPRAV